MDVVRRRATVCGESIPTSKSNIRCLKLLQHHAPLVSEQAGIEAQQEDTVLKWHIFAEHPGDWDLVRDVLTLA